MQPGPVTIVGAGPVGSLLGILLARRGFAPALYERRADMRLTNVAPGRSINLALAARGIHALRHAGVFELLRPLMVPMRGRMSHDEHGITSLQRYGQRESEIIYSVSRAGLNKLLMTEFERVSGTSIGFEQNCRAVDLGRGVLTIIDERAASTGEVSATTVIAADGASSVLRESMVNAGIATLSEEVLKHRYKELTIVAGTSGRHQLDAKALHIWPRAGFMLIALPNTDGTFTATLFLPASGPESFAALHSPALVTEFFKRYFPDVQSFIPALERDFFIRPTGTMATVRCTPWHVGPHLLLIGDAAHAMVPFQGQGMNCAFEDCAAFDELLERHTGRDAVFEEFERLRKPNADAIAEMALGNYAEMRDTVRHAEFQLQKALSLKLERRFPGRFIPRHSMVMFHREIPYATALERDRLQQRLLDELSAGLTNIEQVDWRRAASLLREQLPELDASP